MAPDRIAEDAARGALKEIYAPVDDTGKERKPNFQLHPAIPWESLYLDQSNFFPHTLRPLLSRDGPRWRTLHIVHSSQGEAARNAEAVQANELRTSWSADFFTSSRGLRSAPSIFRKQPASMDQGVF
jgi:hypothetical protein